MFGNTFKILCSLPWIQGPPPEDGKPPFPPKSFSTSTRTRALSGLCVLIGIVQLLSHVWHFVITCMAAKQASLSFTILQSFLKLMSIELVMPPNNFIFCLPLYFLPLIFPCIRVFSNESVLPINWPKYWRFSFSIGPSSWYLGLISFSMDWLDILSVQETLRSLVQHHSLKASILWYSALFMVQLSHPSQLLVKP